MLEQCKSHIGRRMEIEFTPRDGNGRSKGKVVQSGILVGIGSSMTINVENAAVLLLDEPDEMGRQLFMINVTQINRINLTGITTVLIENILFELGAVAATPKAA